MIFSIFYEDRLRHELEKFEQKDMKFISCLKINGTCTEKKS